MNQNTPIPDAPTVSTLSGARPTYADVAPARGAVASMLAADTNATGVSTGISAQAQIDTRYQRAALLLVRCALPRLQSVEANAEADGAPGSNPPANNGVASADVGDADFAVPNHSSSPLIESTIPTPKPA